MRINKNIKLIANYFLGPLVFGFLFYSICRQITHRVGWQHSLVEVWSAMTDLGQWKTWAVLGLMILNWSLESRKWQLVGRPLLHQHFFQAFQATLAGVAIGSFTFNRMGEYLGRILYVPQGKRLQSIPLAMVGSVAQLIATTTAGCVGILLLKAQYSGALSLAGQAFSIVVNVLLWSSGLVALLLMAFFFRLSSVVQFFDWLGWTRVKQIVKDLQEIPLAILFRILCLSFGRYLVFVVQYFLLFSVLGVALTWGQTFCGISLMFLIIAVVPTLTFFTDLGIRWVAGLQIISLFSPNSAGILGVSLGIWLINLVIPALVGSFLILRIKLFRNR